MEVDAEQLAKAIREEGKAHIDEIKRKIVHAHSQVKKRRLVIKKSPDEIAAADSEEEGDDELDVDLEQELTNLAAAAAGAFNNVGPQRAR